MDSDQFSVRVVEKLLYHPHWLSHGAGKSLTQFILFWWSIFDFFLCVRICLYMFGYVCVRAVVVSRQTIRQTIGVSCVATLYLLRFSLFCRFSNSNVVQSYYFSACFYYPYYVVVSAAAVVVVLYFLFSERQQTSKCFYFFLPNYHFN